MLAERFLEEGQTSVTLYCRSSCRSLNIKRHFLRVRDRQSLVLFVRSSRTRGWYSLFHRNVSKVLSTHSRLTQGVWNKDKHVDQRYSASRDNEQDDTSRTHAAELPPENGVSMWAKIVMWTL